MITYTVLQGFDFEQSCWLVGSYASREDALTKKAQLKAVQPTLWVEIWTTPLGGEPVKEVVNV
jgi:hypothetical protein